GLLQHPIKSIAVIEVQGKAQVFAVGEAIQRDVELIEVGADFAIILNRGKQEKLELKAEPNVLMAPGGAIDSTDMTQSLSKKLTLIEQQVKQTPISILGYVRFEFVNNKGKPVMIKVWPKKEAALFNALGFKPGDLLKVVNGHSVEALSKNPALWQALMSESSFSVVVVRQGVEQSLRVELPN
ncbi:MAG: type II secretion system protein N, partial [Pseudomonadota bacterium]